MSSPRPRPVGQAQKLVIVQACPWPPVALRAHVVCVNDRGDFGSALLPQQRSVATQQARHEKQRSPADPAPFGNADRRDEHVHPATQPDPTAA